MLDRQLQDELAKQIINILMNTLPVPYQLKDPAYLFYTLIRTQLLRDEDSFRKAMSDIGNSIARILSKVFLNMQIHQEMPDLLFMICRPV